MSDIRDDLAGMGSQQAAAHALDHDLGELFAAGEVVRERRPAKMVTALRIDLDVQARLEVAAAARGVGTSTLMRQIIEAWVDANADQAALDPVGELVRHLDAARLAATHLTNQAA
jgi:predicted DNA-binding protein